MTLDPMDSPNQLSFIEPMYLEFANGSVELSSPQIESRAKISSDLASVVCGLIAKRQFTIDELRDRVGADGADVLLGFGFVCSSQPELPIPWKYWGGLAWNAHMRTRDATFIRRGTSAMERWQGALASSDTIPVSSLQTRIDQGARVWLPRNYPLMDFSLRSVLTNRRTHRSFLDEAVTLDDLGTVLHYTFGPQRFADAHELGALELRAPVSAGARHETIACVAILNVESLAAGLYAYDGLQHALVSLGGLPSVEELESWTAQQGFFTTGSFGVITVADTAKFAWKYRTSRAYRHMQQNVGAYAQVFSMVSHALGLGAAITGAVAESEIERTLALDAPREMPMFALVAGHPVLTSTGFPVDVLPQAQPAESIGGIFPERRVKRSDEGTRSQRKAGLPRGSLLSGLPPDHGGANEGTVISPAHDHVTSPRTYL